MSTQEAPAASWISQDKPAVPAHLTPAVLGVLEQIAAESKDKGQYLYTQAEMVRAIELAMSKADPLDDAIDDAGGRFTI